MKHSDCIRGRRRGYRHDHRLKRTFILVFSCVMEISWQTSVPLTQHQIHPKSPRSFISLVGCVCSTGVKLLKIHSQSVFFLLFACLSFSCSVLYFHIKIFFVRTDSYEGIRVASGLFSAPGQMWVQDKNCFVWLKQQMSAHSSITNRLRCIFLLSCLKMAANVTGSSETCCVSVFNHHFQLESSILLWLFQVLSNANFKNS